MTDLFKIIGKHAGIVPVPVFDIIQELGIGLKFKALDDDISGWIERHADGSYGITINDRHSLNRKRFTAAHELGHFLYHRELLGAGTGDTRAYRTERTPFENVSIRPKHERQANTFAANLLMPQDRVTVASADGQTNVAVLAEQFGVSEDAMRIRLGR